MASIRVSYEELEYKILAPQASKSAEAIRPMAEERCSIRTEYQRDRDRIIHSKSFRRLKHKTQVFLSPEGDHYRTRLTHTLEVAQIGRTVARALRLNEDLTEAIALGHDLGHTPFGHCGEARLNEIHPGGFKHNEHSYRVVTLLEGWDRGRIGLNLTQEVAEGIRYHSGGTIPSTLEGRIIRFSDKIAYLNHDIDDSIRAGVLALEDIPRSILDELGHTHSARINTLISDLIENSRELDDIRFSQAKQEAYDHLRKFMFQNVYLNEVAKKEERKAMDIVEALYRYYAQHPDQMPEHLYKEFVGAQGIEAVKDYVAGMSDRFAVNRFQDLFVPDFWL